MSRFMLSAAVVLASLAGSSATLSGATPATRPLPTAHFNGPVDGPYYTRADAEADARYREGQGYETEIVYDDAGDFWYVYCS